jgi:hypothetical protein
MQRGLGDGRFPPIPSCHEAVPGFSRQSSTWLLPSSRSGNRSSGPADGFRGAPPGGPAMLIIMNNCTSCNCAYVILGRIVFPMLLKPRLRNQTFIVPGMVRPFPALAWSVMTVRRNDHLCDALATQPTYLGFPASAV